MSEPELHADLEPLAFLLGTWTGEGSGVYPTIEGFRYAEEIRFSHVGKPFLVYGQRTWHPEKKLPMHAETGFWRPAGPGRVEVVLAHPSGVVEVQEGTLSGSSIELRSTTIARTSTAKEVTALARAFVVEGDIMRYEVRMAAVGLEMQLHLSAKLSRTG